MAFDLEALLQSPAFLSGLSILSGDPRNLGQNAIAGLQAASQLQAQRQVAEQRKLALDAARRKAAFNPMDYMTTKPGLVAQDPNMAGPPVAMQGTTPMDLGTVQAGFNRPALLSGAMSAGFDPSDVASMVNVLQKPDRKLINVGPGGALVDELTGEPVFQAPFKPPEAPSSLREIDILVERLRRNPEDVVARDTLGKITGADAKAAAADRQEQLRLQRETLNEQRKAAAEQKQTQFVDTQVGKLQDDLVREQIPQMTPVMQGIQDVLKKYPKGDLPGFSKRENAAANFGMGWMLNEEAQSVRQALMPLANITIKVRSGAAVTQPEWDRFRQELGSGTLMSPERIRQGLKMFQDIYADTVKGVGAGYSDDVVKAYERRFPGVSFGRKGESGGGDRAEAAKAELRRRGLIQ